MMAAHIMLPYKEIGNNMFAAKQAFYPLTDFGNSAYFTSGAYLSITSATNLIKWATSTGFTIEYWITGWSNADGFDGPGNHNITGTNYWAFGPSGNSLNFPYYLNNIITINNVVNSSIWNNVCLVASPASIVTPNNTTLRFYVNGELVLTQAATLTAIDVNIPFIIGLSNFGDWSDVYMDNLRVSNVNRYSGSSYTLAAEPFTSDASTQLLLTCDGANGSTSITDSSGFARTVTNNGVVISNARQNHS